MTEIGSEFRDVPVSEEKNNLFPAFTRWYLSGRSALKAVLAQLKDRRTAALPSWCCDSMIKPFADAGIEVKFYPVYPETGLKQEIRKDCDILFLMDYFGFSSPAPDLSDYRGTVIRDVTHSLFSREYTDADYYFGSLRKWCGVYTGGFAYAKDGSSLAPGSADSGEYAALRKEAMRLKSLYLDRQPDSEGNFVTDKKYLEIFARAEEMLEDAGIAPAGERDIILAEKLDVNFIRERRRENASILISALSDMLVFPEMKDEDCPMFVPVFVPGSKRNALRKHLIQNEIYCPVHWPVSSYHELGGREKYIYDCGLSLVCDQRYTAEDMNRIVTAVKSFLKEV